MSDDDDAVEDLAGENDFLRIRLEMLHDHLPGIAVYMHNVLSCFLEAGFSVDHSMDMARVTYERVLSDFSL